MKTSSYNRTRRRGRHLVLLVASLCLLCTQVCGTDIRSLRMPLVDSWTYLHLTGDFISVVREQTSEPIRCFVYNITRDKSVTFEDLLFVAVPQPIRDGNLFLTQTVQEPEGPSTYTIFDLDKQPHATLQSRFKIVAATNGRYFYTVQSLTSPGVPLIYDSNLTLFKKVELTRGATHAWDACMIGDSLYVLRQFSDIQIYRLPSFDKISEFHLELPKGAPLLELLCSKSGSLCAVSNYLSLGVVQISTGSSFVVKTRIAEYVHLRNDGRGFTTVDTKGSTLHLSSYRINNGECTLDRTTDIAVGQLSPGAIRVVVERSWDGGDTLLLGVKVITSTAPPVAKLQSLLICRPDSATQSVSPILLEGVVWPSSDTGVTHLYQLKESEIGRADFRRINATEVEHE
jgi:hypothetical protein